MRQLVRVVLVASAFVFLVWEVYGAVRWVSQAGGIGPAFDHLWSTLAADWMALIVVSDHAVIAGAVLVALWTDAKRVGWLLGRRMLLAIAFVALGSPTLLVYLAWRIDAPDRSITG
jgi:hypothetical protein